VIRKVITKQKWDQWSVLGVEQVYCDFMKRDALEISLANITKRPCGKQQEYSEDITYLNFRHHQTGPILVCPFNEL
jgi:hypothetical protein